RAGTRQSPTGSAFRVSTTRGRLVSGTARREHPMNLWKLDTAVVIAGPDAAPDVAVTSLRRGHGTVDAMAELSRVRRAYDGPLLVEPFSARDLPAIEAHADGVMVGGAWMQDFQLLRAAARTGRRVVVQRAPAATLEEWLSAAEYCVAEGNDDVVLCEA